MLFPKNNFKANLERVTYGTWNAIPHTYAADICAGAGFDWVCVDMEHAPLELTDVLHHVQTIAGHPGVSAVVRPPDHDVARIKRLLDIGVQSLIVPMVDTAAQAEALVRALRYPPNGVRGVASAMVRAARFGNVENYPVQADAEMCLIVQIETDKGLANLEAITKLDGVDGVLFGPADLAASMGFLGEPAHPEVVAAIVAGIGRVRALGKAAGTLALSQESVATYKAAGATIIGTAVDLMLLNTAARDVVAGLPK
jgi:4-hydroxy-2-oxoheptanedioate aldolase